MSNEIITILFTCNCSIFLPVTVSSNNTPKLKTSDFVENNPSVAYSGAMYPLQETIVHQLQENFDLNL